MSLSPTASFTLGDLKYGSHAAHLSVTLSSCPEATASRSTCQRPRRSAANRRSARHDLDGGGGGDDGDRRNRARNPPRLRACPGDRRDASVDLAALRSRRRSSARPARTWCRDGRRGRRLGADNDLDLSLGAYATDQRRTAAEHIAYLAGLGGALALVDAENRLVLRQLPSGPADVALLYGREIVACDAARVSDARAGDSDRQRSRWQRRCGGRAPAHQEAVAGGRDRPGPAARWLAVPVLRTPGVAVAAGQAYERRARAPGAAANPGDSSCQS
jgi:hypothetical protein